jgi:hypothetical protein
MHFTKEMEGNMEEYSCKFYMIEPGDATRYKFSICDCPEMPGVGDGLKYIILNIMMIDTCSVVLPRKFSVAHTMHDSKLQKVYSYTRAAVLLAARALLDGLDENQAAREMLRAGEFA